MMLRLNGCDDDALLVRVKGGDDDFDDDGM